MVGVDDSNLQPISRFSWSEGRQQLGTIYEPAELTQWFYYEDCII